MTHDFKPEPFRDKYLDGDPRKSKQDKIQVSLNKEERALLEEIKELLECPYDSTVMKMGLLPLRNILLVQLGKGTVRYICSVRRNRKL